jgi:predicted metal-dependent peptidase
MAEQKNILAIYNFCQELVLKVEATKGKNVDPGILSALEEAFKSIIDFSKGYLIRYIPFNGGLLMSLDIKTDMKMRGTTDLDVSKQPITIYLNPLLMVKRPFLEFMGDLNSELLRLAFAHPAVFGQINSGKDKQMHEFLEKSSSASVSEIIKKDMRLDREMNKELMLRAPKDMYTTAKMAEETKYNPKESQSLEYYYKFLKNFHEKNKGQNPMTPPMGIPQESNGGKQNQENDGDSKPDPNGVATNNNQNGRPTHQWEGGDSDSKMDRIKSLVSDVYENLSEKERGTMPGKLVEHIKNMLKKPEISWKGVLRRFVGAIPVPHRKTRTRLNRRQPKRADLSGQLPKRHVELVVALDTSGSMSTSDITYVINEIFNIVKEYDTKVTIIECDAEIGKIYQAKKPSDVQTKITGRGGTSFVPVIDYINESGAYREALLIYFTDGYGDSEIPRPRTYRNLWVVLQDEKHLSVKEPYGEVKALRKDQDWIKLNRDGDF